MRVVVILLAALGSHSCLVYGRQADGSSVGTAVSAFMILIGVAMAGMWGWDLLRQEKVDRSHGLWRARERGTGQRMLPHLVAEYATSVSLVAGAIGLLLNRSWGRDVGLLAIGALVYASTNALSWVMTESSRWPYGIPIGLSLVGSLACLVQLV